MELVSHSGFGIGQDEDQHEHGDAGDHDSRSMKG